MIAILAILKTGAAYVPIDTSDPSRRVAEMLRDCGAACVVSTSRLARRLAGCAVSVVPLDEIADEMSAGNCENLASSTSATSPCYVMYTSGSTGRPKGVQVPHRAVVRLVCGTNYLAFGEHRVFLALAPICFDASTFEVWGALLHGACLVIAPEGSPDPQAILALVEQHQVCTLWLTAGLFNALVDSCPRIFSHLEQLIIGGEALSVHHVRMVDRVLPPGARIVNGYGPTEGTTFSCCYDIPRPVAANLQSVPIGRPVANTRAYVLDEQLRPIAIGEQGELCIAGDGLADGYLQAPQLTAEKFVTASMPGLDNERLYRTGDLVRCEDDGNLVFLGRIDEQLKIRGHRVEPGEIECALRQHLGVAHCLVGIRPAGSDQQLVAYFVADGPPPASSDLRSHLRRMLPEYMLPAAFVEVPEVPLCANGKVDRRRLAELGANDAVPGHVGLLSEHERLMADMWADVLGTMGVGRNDHFIFDLAGNSLLALQLVDRVNRRFGVRLTVPDLLTTPTVASMAAKVAERASPQHATQKYLSIIRQGDGQNPVVCVGLGHPVPLLEAALPEEVPIWWLRLDGLHAPPFAVRPVDAIATSYAAELEEAVGEITLVGNSFGGLITLDLAHRLRAAGRRVRAMVLEPPLADFFECEDDVVDNPGGKYSGVPVRDRLAAVPLRIGRELRRGFRNWILRPGLQFAVRMGRPLPVRFRNWWYYYPQIRERVRSCKIERASGRICMVGQASYLAEHLSAWQALLDGPIETCCLPTAKQHADVVARPAAEGWLAILRSWANETSRRQKK
jgi:amino acid adenylation domain-containing protein